nr:multidrug and toxin extrusion protein 1 [Hymenolepis microstoma]
MEYKSTESINSVYELQDDLPPKKQGRWGYYFPYGFWYEFKHLQMLAVPLMLTGMSNYAIVPISVAFLGHLGKSELAAGGLAISIFHVAGLSIIAGLLTASETLFSQTIGGENKFRLGIQVQKAAVILTFCCMPCWAIYIISEPILLSTNQPPLVAKYTSYYLLGLIPGLIFLTLVELCNRYIQCQNKVYPTLLASLTANVVNALSHYLFVYKSEFGFVGSAISQSLGYLAQTLVLIGYLYFSRLYRKTWDGIHVELWHDWGVWFRLAIPGMVMTGLEWWVCESGSILAGLRGENALAVQTILNNIESLLYCMFPLGLLLSTTIRIGQFLGANKSDGPRSTSIVALITILANNVIITITLIFTRSYIPRIFTRDPVIIDSAANGIIAIAVFLFVDSIVAVCSGIIRGVGMQKVGGIVCIICMYLIGGPLGISLLLFTDLGVAGFWYGVSAGTGSEAIIYIIIILRIDWSKMCQKAQKRTEIKFVNKSASQQQIEDKEAAAESESSDWEKVDSDSEVKACTPKIVFTRTLLITFCVVSIIVALVMRFHFDWKSYFQTYCLHMNGDLIAVPTATATDFDFSKCQKILP